jgi:hypothetical protein
LKFTATDGYAGHVQYCVHCGFKLVASTSGELHQRWAETREAARLLIESKPWLNRSDWAAGRIVNDQDSLSFISYWLLTFCLVTATVSVYGAYAEGQWEFLFFTAFFLVLATPLIYLHLRAHRGKAECLLRTVPARIGDVLEAEVKARLVAARDAEVHVWLANERREGTGGSLWVTEQRIPPQLIQIATDGTWTIPVRIALPATLRAQALTAHWALQVRVKNVGADFQARFDVPVFDLADLPYGEDRARSRWAPPYAAVRFRLADFSYGALVGVLIGLALSLRAAGYSGLEGLFRAAGHRELEGLFLAPFSLAIFAFGFLGSWRAGAASALRDRHLPGKEAVASVQLIFLTLAPWAAVALVLWFAWAVLPFAGIVWGIGMALCAHPSVFGRFWRDPLFQSGAVLTVCSLLL